MNKIFTLWAACALPMLSPISAQEVADEHAQTRKDRERLIDLVIDLEADFSSTLRDYTKLQKDYSALLKKPAAPDQSGKIKELQTKLKQALAKLDAAKPTDKNKRNQALLEQDLVNLRNELHRERQDLLVARARMLRVQQLENQNKALQTDLEKSTADRTKINSEVKTLMTQLQTGMQKLAKAEQSNREAIARIGQLKKETTVLKQKVKTRDGQLAKLRTEQAQYKKAMAAAAAYKKEQEQLQTLLDEREKQLANLQSHLNAEVKRTLEIPILIKARDELERKLTTSTTNTGELRKENESLTAKKSKLENEIKAVEKSITSMRTQLDKNKVVIASVAKLTRENQILEAEQGDLENTIAMAKGELIKAMGVRNRLEAELAESKKLSAETVALSKALEDTNKGLIAEQSLLQEHLVETKKAVGKSAKEKEQLKASVATLEKAKEDLAAKLDKREEDLSKTRKELGRLQIDSTIVENKLTALKRAKAIITPVRYAKGEADVSEQQTRVLTQVQQVLKLFPSARFEIVGHTCDLGTATGNLKLSQQRAKALHEFLISKGIKGDRLKFRGVGQSEPAVPNTNETNRRQNRRVVVEILD